MDGFIVWRWGAREPESQHDNYTEAGDHAKHLAKVHPGAKYYVLKVISEYEGE